MLLSCLFFSFSSTAPPDLQHRGREAPYQGMNKKKQFKEIQFGPPLTLRGGGELSLGDQE